MGQHLLLFFWQISGKGVDGHRYRQAEGLADFRHGRRQRLKPACHGGGIGCDQIGQISAAMIFL